MLDSTSLPLGVDEANASCRRFEPIRLQPGDLLLLFTDGVFEAESVTRQRFGVDRALEVIQAHRERPAKEIITALRGALDEFCENQPIQDDVTVVIVKFVG